MGRKCFVGYCNNDTNNSRNKIFVKVPTALDKRKLWFQAARRNSSVKAVAGYYCCEDHFDLEYDMENYTEYKVKQTFENLKTVIRLKPNVVPHKFNWLSACDDSLQFTPTSGSTLAQTVIGINSECKATQTEKTKLKRKRHTIEVSAPPPIKETKRSRRKEPLTPCPDFPPSPKIQSPRSPLSPNEEAVSIDQDELDTDSDDDIPLSERIKKSKNTDDKPLSELTKKSENTGDKPLSELTKQSENSENKPLLALVIMSEKSDNKPLSDLTKKSENSGNKPLLPLVIKAEDSDNELQLSECIIKSEISEDIPHSELIIKHEYGEDETYSDVIIKPEESEDGVFFE